MLSSYSMDNIRKNVKIIFNDLSLYNIWVGEVVGQISDGKWENSRRPMEYFWLPDAVYDAKAEQTGWCVDPKAYLKFHYTEKGAMPNPLSNDLVGCEVHGDYFYVRRICACIAAANAGVKVTCDNSSPIEYLWNRVTCGKSFDKCMEEMREKDKEDKSVHGAYNGLKRLELSDEQVSNLWSAMHYFWVESLGGDNYYGPYSKARKVVVAELKRLKEEMHKVFDLA